MHGRSVILAAVDPGCPNSLRHEIVVLETYFETRADTGVAPVIKPPSFFVEPDAASESTVLARNVGFFEMSWRTGTTAQRCVEVSWHSAILAQIYSCDESWT